VLARALEPLPKAVRKLDALHLASIDFLQKQGQSVTLPAMTTGSLTAPAPFGFRSTSSSDFEFPLRRLSSQQVSDRLTEEEAGNRIDDFLSICFSLIQILTVAYCLVPVA
jgi:hypothetical protein